MDSDTVLEEIPVPPAQREVVPFVVNKLENHF
jgi:hypothetical protein